MIFVYNITFNSYNAYIQIQGYIWVGPYKLPEYHGRCCSGVWISKYNWNTNYHSIIHRNQLARPPIYPPTYYIASDVILNTCSASDRPGSNLKSCVWRAVSSHSSHYPQEVLLASFISFPYSGISISLARFSSIETPNALKMQDY